MMRPTYLFTVFLVLQGIALLAAYTLYPEAKLLKEPGLISLVTALPMALLERHAGSRRL
jgi:hypothetical protein